MSGNKVVITYKRKRHSQSRSFISGNRCQNSVGEDTRNCSLSKRVKHDNQTAETSEKHEEKSTDTSDGKKLCSGSIKQPDLSSPLPVQKPGGLEGEELGNCDETELIITTKESFLTSHPCEDNSKKDVDDLAPIKEASQNGCGTQKNSCVGENSGNECDNGSNKNNTSTSVEMDAAENDINLINSETSITRESSAACGDEPLVLNKSTDRFTKSPSNDNVGNQSEHKVTQTSLTSPLTTYRCYKRRKCMDGTDKKSNLLHEKEKIPVLTKWSMLANANADPSSSDDESSCDECPAHNVPDLNQSVELLEREKPLDKTQDDASCRSLWFLKEESLIRLKKSMASW